MDRIIASYEFREDKDLRIVDQMGIAYQYPMKVTAKYDKSYFEKCRDYGVDNPERHSEINSGRIDLVSKWSGQTKSVLDIGIGSGDFIKKRNIPYKITKGYDINPFAVEWLEGKGIYAEDFDKYDTFCMWDVLEHCEYPEIYLKRMKKNSILYVSIPIFDSLDRIRKSHHYRPDEHLYYFTEPGFVQYMQDWGFSCVDRSDFESKAGRDNIKTFVFKKNIQDYDDLIMEYNTLHSSRYYGHSSESLLDDIVPIVKRFNPKSILDYGCGRSSLVSYFYNDGSRKIYRYDPAIKQYNTLPVKKVDLVLCNDVMEHIFKRDLDRVLKSIKSVSKNVIFTISTAPARAMFTNGLNAHVTIMPRSWWIKLFKRYFKDIYVSDFTEHYILFRTFK